MEFLFNRVFGFIPKEYRNQSCIAGGAAVSLMSAGDIDVFILGINEEYKAENLKKALTAAKIPGLEFRDQPVPVKDIDFLLNDSAVDGHFNVIAEIDNELFQLKIQIMGSPFMAVTDLLKDFDLSTHCVAYTPDGTRHTIPETTPVPESPKVVHSNIPGITISRYRKLCKRYGLKPDPNELVKLCEMPDPV